MRARALLLVAALSACAPELTPRERALVRIARGEVREGVLDLERIKDESPRDPLAWIDLGHGYELLHRYDDALAAYDEAARVAPEDPRGPREGGLRAAKWGEHEAARARLEEAVRRGDDEPETFHALGLVRLALHDRAGARTAYTACLKLPKAKDDASCVLGLATVAVVEDDAAEALRWYEELARRKPRYAPAHLGRAWALGSLGRFAEGDAAVEDAIAAGAPAEDVARMRGWLAKRRGGS